MKKGLVYRSILLTLLALVPTTSQAISIGFDPISQTVGFGHAVDVALVISGLGAPGPPAMGVPSLSAFDLDISFDPTILGFNTAIFGDPVLGDQLDIWGIGGNPLGASIASPGVLNVFEVSLDLPWDLEDYQVDSFTLATLTFDILAVGTSSLDISNIRALGDAWGDPLTAGVQTGSISPVPEPTTLLLVSTGLIGLAYLKRKSPIGS